MRARAVLPILAVTVLAALATVPVRGAGAAGKRSTSGCGRNATTGVTTQHVVVHDEDREYRLSIPDGYQRSTPVPLLFDFHGLGSDMQEQALYTGLEGRGGARGDVVITPDGDGKVLRHWSLTPATPANPDVAFVQAMLRTTGKALCIDRDRVFATGISNGAMFSMLLVCALPGRLAAVAPVAGVNATPVCAAGTPRTSVLAFHGTADPIVPYEGGAYFSGRAPAGALAVPRARPVDDAVAAWAAFDGCGSEPSTADVAGDVAGDVQHLTWPHCPPGLAVQLYRVIGGGHTWPGAVALRQSRLGATTSSIDATELVLDFFDAHPKR